MPTGGHMTRTETRRLRRRPGWTPEARQRLGSTRREIIGRISRPRLCSGKKVTTFARSRGFPCKGGKEAADRYKKGDGAWGWGCWTLHTASTRDRRSRQADRQRDGTVVFAGFRRDHGEWSGVERTVEWSGVGAAQEPEYRGDGDAHAHLIEYRKEEKKREKALVPSLSPSSFGFTYALFFYRGDRC